MAIVTASNVTKFYQDHKALNEFSLSIEQGQCFALLGKNGAGKTTFVKSLLNLISFKSGEIKLFDKEVTDKTSRSLVGYLPEKFNFYPYYTLYGVCEFYGKMKGLSGDTLRKDILNAMERLSLSGLENKKVKQCSKGQLQRAGLASMLVGNSELLILDEPHSGLDPIGIKDVQQLILDLQKEGKTIFINSHGLDSVEKVCDHIAIIDKGEGLVQGHLKTLIGNQSLLDFFYEKVEK